MRSPARVLPGSSWREHVQCELDRGQEPWPAGGQGADGTPAWAIIYSGKDVENRRWRTSYRGPLPLSSRAADASGLRVPPAAVTDKLTGLV